MRGVRFIMRSVIFTLLFGLASASSLQKEKEKEVEPKNPVAVIKTNHGDIYVELFAKEAPKTVDNFIRLAEGKKEFTDPDDEKKEKKIKRPFYDGLIFHRVIKDFMIQGGCPKGDGTGGPGYSFEDEINATELGLGEMKVIDGNNAPHKWLLIRSRQDFGRIVVGPLLKKLGIGNQEQLKARAGEVEKKLKELTLKECYENLGYVYSEKLKSHHPKKGVIAMANSGPNTNGSQFFINLIDTPWLTGKHTVFGKVVKGMDVVEEIGNVKVDDRARPVEDVKILSIRLSQ